DAAVVRAAVHFLEIRPGAERLVAGAGQDGHAQRGIGVELTQPLAEQPRRFEIERVHRLGAIDRDARDGAAGVVQDLAHYFSRHSFHASLTLSRFGPHQSPLSRKPFLMLSGYDDSSGRSLGSTIGIALVLVGPNATYLVSSAWGFGCSAQLMNFIVLSALGAPFGTTHASYVSAAPS